MNNETENKGYRIIEYCVECCEPILMPEDMEEMELVTCSNCGLEYELHMGKLRVLETEDGEDFGE
jgi:hypothetical protein